MKKEREGRQVVLLRTLPKLHELLAREAKTKKVSVNALINKRLEEGVKFLGIPKIPIKMTDKEFNAVVKEFGRRLKDVIFARAEIGVGAELKKYRKDISTNDQITLTWEFYIRGDDIVQVLGRLRRKNK